ncbi:phospholipase B family protein [Pseudomonas sp. LS1212]|uniref:C45 family autoproteolytic acyltransferase/hydolase n=1 Tax=Pseudomonas sp. LS1212 TaxID=2972478 RepID=UPI00215CF97B|nr:C45 family peptidase [Pseudomonas sp. LS1212]UVJ45923.1 phospholipase B family protein [Pseudomonas sp. LS1212]
MSSTNELTASQRAWLEQANRTEHAGWIHLAVKGTPFERGFQHGYLAAREYAEAKRVYAALTYTTMGMTLDFFLEQGARLHKDKIPPELLAEMDGIATGLTQAGVHATLDEIIGWNAYMEITGYWWPTAMHQYTALEASGSIKGKSHCSAFIATGSATTDGQIVLGHETFTEFWNGQSTNLILDITPDKGYRMVMQAAPGWIASMTDFWITSANLVVAETTIVGFSSYDATKTPEYVRARMACQYADDIDGWVRLMDNENNGGYANMWLVGDLKTNTIAKYEQGLKYQSLETKTDGCYFGCNVPEDPRIRNLECTDVGYDDVRQQTGARRVRWPQLLSKFAGKIDAQVGQAMLADTFDVYLMRIEPSSRTICAHYDKDPQHFASDPNAVWNIPFFPGGSVDGKVTTAALARKMDLWARFGRADGAPFDAEEFLAIHPQFDYQQGYLQNRPSQPWTLFQPETQSMPGRIRDDA